MPGRVCENAWEGLWECPEGLWECPEGLRECMEAIMLATAAKAWNDWMGLWEGL